MSEAPGLKRDFFLLLRNTGRPAGREQGKNEAPQAGGRKIVGWCAADP